MFDDLLDESLFDETFDSDPQCNCECGCKVPVMGQCVDLLQGRANEPRTRGLS